MGTGGARIGAGRKKKATATRVLSGGWAGPQRPRATAGPPAVPDAPGWLTEAERVVWAELVTSLAPLNILTLADGPALATFARTMAEYQRINQRLVAAGDTVITTRNEKGDVTGVVNHPLVKQREYLARECRMWCERFLLAPGVRLNRLAIAPAPTKSWREILLDDDAPA